MATDIPRTPGFRLGQRPCLDGLRGLSVFAVVFGHLHGGIPGAMVGVEILFVLSGFLITVLLIEEREKTGAISLPNFYRKRFLRVLPPLFALLVIGSAVSILTGFEKPWDMLRESAVAALFLTNAQTLLRVPMMIFGHTWTLALEVQFYLLWPVAFYFLLRANVRRERILLILVCTILAAAAWRTVLFTMRPPSGPERQAFLMRLFMGPDTHSDTLLVGCLAGALVAWNRLRDSASSRARLHVAGCLSLAGLTFMTLFCHHEQHAFYCGLFTLSGVMAATVIVWLTLAPPRLLLWALEFPVLAGLGRISYALYLYHMPIAQWLPPNSFGAAALALTLSLAAAVLSFYFLERPFIRAKRRLHSAAAQEPSRLKQAA